MNHDEDPTTAAVRAAIREQSLDRFASDYIDAKGRDWLAGFAARAAISRLTELGWKPCQSEVNP